MTANGTAKKEIVFAERLILFLAIACSFYMIGQATAWADWRVGCVDCAPNKDFEEFYPRSIAVDSLNHPHIAYGKNNLYHAFFDGTRWILEIVDNHNGVGAGASIAI